MSDLNNIIVPDAPTTAERVAAGELEATEDYHTYPSPSQPMQVSRRLVGDLFTTNGLATLVYWRGDWWQWNRTSWRLLDDELDVKEPLWHRLEDVTYLDKEGDQKAWAPTTAKVHNLMEPLAIRSRIPGALDAPAWLDDTGDQPAGTVIGMKNGLLDLDTKQLSPHTPLFFNTWALDFDYNPNATCPVWDKFLTDVFAHDPAAALLLQEYVGYLISGRTDMHKALLIVGPRRGGKGTISRTVQQLVGLTNSVSPSLSSLGSEFGLASLIGKPLAVVEDARADDDRRNNATVERLLNIIGEDAVSINRKNRDYWDGTLPTRFMLFSNETPRFLDSSGAITSRFISVRLKASFETNPDTELGAKLRRELPGIFNWALAGLQRLDEQERFTIPETMAEMTDLMSDLASPVMRFLDEKFTITGSEDDTMTVTEVFAKFKAWAEDQEMKTMNRDTFIQRVLAAQPAVTFKNTAVPGRSKTRLFFGLKENSWGFTSQSS